jgi:ribosomal protein S18 acetylase RimI-like enzyme
MQISFRAATLTDIDWLIEAMREFNAIEDYGFNESIARPALEKFIPDSSLGGLWLIEAEGKAVGYVVLTFGYSFEFHGRDAFVDELFIEADYRGRGIGRQAMRFIEERCREFGVKALHLEVDRTNFAGQALYQKSGFKDHDRFLMTRWITK